MLPRPFDTPVKDPKADFLIECFDRPGDYLQADDDEIDGFKHRLNERLAPVGSQFSGDAVNDEWQIGDTLAQWWRPNFETFMYPFLPAHVTRPKECKKLYFIQLPKSSMPVPKSLSIKCFADEWLIAEVLSVPKNMKLLAVPLFELYDNTARYGPQLSAIPHLLSRYKFEFVDEEGNVCAATPGGDPGPRQIKVLAKGEDEDAYMNGNGEQDGSVKLEEQAEPSKTETQEAGAANLGTEA